MSIKKKILIVTADNILPYQPTILNIYDALMPFFDVQIISFEPGFVAKHKIENKQVIYINNKNSFYQSIRFVDNCFNFFLKKISKLNADFTLRIKLEKVLQIFLLKKSILKNKSDKYISVDFVALKAFKELNLKSNFLSLEIIEHDPYRKNIAYNLIDSVIIQSKNRYDYLFKNKPLQLILLPNSPVYKDYKNATVKGNLIWAGSIVKSFGVEYCIDFIKIQSLYSLTLKGGVTQEYQNYIEHVYSNEFDNKKLIINTEYMNDNDFITFISKFKIGLCFYDWDLIKNNFNYRSAPSGKLFMYLLAGVPVIACDIEGFQFIKENKCGVLIKDYSSKSIQEAINEIESNYLEYETNCIATAKEFDFSKYMQVLIQHLSI